MKSLRASFHGPLARVAINTAGPVLVLYFLATAAAFAVAGIVWWAAAALAVGPTLIGGEQLDPLRASRGGRERRQRIQVVVDEMVDQADGGEIGCFALGRPLPQRGHVGAGHRWGSPMPILILPSKSVVGWP
ncbi:MAG: hypothetical protein QOH66_2957 [Actinomycetota bacterium]|nr:hypothetical protein [Actinomycetota bacterium]